MKRWIAFGAAAVCAILAVCAIRLWGEQPVKYSNLTEQSVINELDSVMWMAGVSDARRERFYRSVKQFNRTVSAESLTHGYEICAPDHAKYDPFDMQNEWNARYPDFPGYNSRITAFGLFGDFISVPSSSPYDDEMVLLDLSSLESDSSVLMKYDDKNRFKVLYSTVATDATDNIDIHVRNLRADWQKRGFVFRDSPQIRLITVILHESYEEENVLFVGYAGVLFPVSEHELWFVEKLAFQEPYQLTKFHNRGELKQYLMRKYEGNTDRTAAPPFVMENDALMAG